MNLNFFVSANTFYVSSSGNDSNSGTIEFPFKTIEKAVSQVSDNDTINICKGVYYYSKLNLSNRKNIVIKNNNIEKVELHGTKLTSNWISLGNKTWYCLTKDSVIQLFKNNTAYFQAAYPSIKLNGVSTESWMDGIAYPNKNIYLKNLNKYRNLEGALVLGLCGKGLVSLNGTVNRHNGEFVNVTNEAFYWSEQFQNDYLINGKFFITGNKQFLDDENEWFWQNDTLFLISSSNPNNDTIEIRNHLYNIDCSNSQNILIHGIDFLYTNIDFSDNESSKISNCKITFPTPFFTFPDGFERFKYLRDSLNQLYFASPETWTGKGLTISGKNNTIENCYIAHSWGDGLTIWGENHTVKNNIITDCDWIANDCAAISITGKNHLIQNNTAYNTARSVLVHRKLENSKIINNHFYNAGILCEDLGVTYTYDTDGANTEIAYNYIHDNKAYESGAAIYLDNGNSNFSIHHNIITNSLIGINLNKTTDNNLIYNNTLYGNTYSMGSWGPDGTTISNVKTFNNLTNTDKKAKWNYDAFYGTSKDSNYIYFNSNIFIDPDNSNFQLRKYSLPIDQGIKNQFTIEYVGSLPDKGAFEHGKAPWVYGSNLIIQNEPNLIPKAPLNLKLIKNTHDTTLFEWEYPFGFIDTFYLERRISTENNFKVIARLTKDKFEYNDANQPPGEFRYQVRAKNNIGISDASNSIQVFNPADINSLYFDAENADYMEGTATNKDILINADNKDWICFKQINLDSSVFDACMVNMAVPCEYAWQEIQVRLDKPMGRLIGKLRPPSTGGWDIFKQFSFPVEQMKGTHDVYFRFKGEYGIGTIDWFTFYNSYGSVKDSILNDTACPFPSSKINDIKTKIFPNPTTQSVRYSFDCQEITNIEIEIFDTKGIIYYKDSFENLTPGTIELPLDDNQTIKSLNPGVYMVKSHIQSKKVDEYRMNKFIKISE